MGHGALDENMTQHLGVSQAEKKELALDYYLSI
jgi:hypothetical protein